MLFAILASSSLVRHDSKNLAQPSPEFLISPLSILVSKYGKDKIIDVLYKQFGYSLEDIIKLGIPDTSGIKDNPYKQTMHFGEEEQNMIKDADIEKILKQYKKHRHVHRHSNSAQKVRVHRHSKQ